MSQETKPNNQSKELRKDEAFFVSLIESFMFTFSDVVSIEDIERFFAQNEISVSKSEISSSLDKLKEKYEKKDSGLELSYIDGKYQIVTKASNYIYLVKVLEPVKKKNLTQSVMETLAIIAYNQPTTKGYVEKIKGVKSDYAISKLLEAGLIQEDGRLDKIGRPFLYKTTDLFLKYMGLSTLDQLPKIEMTRDTSEDGSG